MGPRQTISSHASPLGLDLPLSSRRHAAEQLANARDLDPQAEGWAIGVWWPASFHARHRSAATGGAGASAAARRRSDRPAAHASQSAPLQIAEQSGKLESLSPPRRLLGPAPARPAAVMRSPQPQPTYQIPARRRRLMSYLSPESPIALSADPRRRNRIPFDLGRAVGASRARSASPPPCLPFRAGQMIEAIHAYAAFRRRRSSPAICTHG